MLNEAKFEIINAYFLISSLASLNLIIFCSCVCCICFKSCRPLAEHSLYAKSACLCLSFCLHFFLFPLLILLVHDLLTLLFFCLSLSPQFSVSLLFQDKVKDPGNYCLNPPFTLKIGVEISISYAIKYMFQATFFTCLVGIVVITDGLVALPDP